MRVAIALAKDDATRVYPGPFGHAPRYAIYEAGPSGELVLLEIRENPYAKAHGEEKHAKMRELLRDVDLKVSLGAFPLADRVEVGPVSLEEALARLKERSSA